MCDYSLCGIPNRLAVEGEELVVHRFQTGSMGLASPTDLKAREPAPGELSNKGLWHRIRSIFDGLSESPMVRAVCVPPGAYLILKDVPADLQREYGVEEQEGVVFVQTGLSVNTYRDAVQFHNGLQIQLQSLPAGLRLEVLSLADTLPVRNERESDLRVALPSARAGDRR